MSIYTTAQIQGNNSLSDVFAEHRLYGQRATTLGSVNITATLLKRGNLYYAAAAANLPATLAAMSGSRVSIDQGPTNSINKMDGYEHEVEPPVLLIEDVRAGDKEFLEEVGMMEWAERKGAYVGKPSVTNFRGIVALDYATKELVPSGHVKIPGYYAFIIGWKSVVQFACWSRFAIDKLDLHVLAAAGKVEKQENGKEKQEGLGGSTWKVNEERWAQTEKMGAELYKIEDGDLVNVPGSGTLDEAANAFLNLATDSWQDDIMRGGYVFPYFRGLIQPDADFLANTFVSTFFTCTHADPDRLAKTLGYVRSGFRHLSLSNPGMALSHALFGVKLALQMQASYQVICEGLIYRGFVLGVKGEGIVFAGNLVKQPLDKQGVIAEVSSLNVHKEALSRIIEMVEGWAMKANTSERIKITWQITSARQLADQIRLRAPPLAAEDGMEGKWQKKLTDDLRLLNFGETYWTLSAARLQTAIAAMSKGWHDQTAPFYLAPSLEWMSNHDAYCLSVFGPRVPTIFAGDTQVTIPSTEVATDPNLQASGEGIRALQYIPIYIQPYAQAIGSWRRVATGSKISYFKGVGTAFAKRQKDNGIVSGPDFMPFYQELKEYCEYHRVTATALGKRGRADDSGKPGSQKMTRSELREMYTDF